MSTTSLSVIVKRICPQAADILSFELVPAGAEALPACTPGSHIDVALADGIVRQYSLCNGPGEDGGYIIAVKREPVSRGGSAAMHERVREGDVLSISLPRNHFPIDWSAQSHLLLAGGIGITPLLSMARHLQAAGAGFHLHYFARSDQHTAFRELLASPDLRSKVSLHHGLSADEVKTCMQGLLASPAPMQHLYFCGPAAFMGLAADLAQPVWPAGSVHMEYFSAPVSDAPQGSFEVHMKRSGGNCIVPEGKSIVEALAEKGIMIETSCEQGVCGTCLVNVCGGEPDHRDFYLSDQEKRDGDKILPCVSRSRSPVLILDV
ncbi:MAG: oxidoreductase/oxygenase, vanB family [Paucimonas sp.]|nr:oxidoreductase/oxygenase, vanB family [Paucimonas sp.]